MTYPNGIKYEGTWKNDKKNGRGTMIYTDGTNEDLEFSDDEPVNKSTKKKKPFEIDIDF
jgi:hypothetical protein